MLQWVGPLVSPHKVFMCMCSFWPISYMLCFLYNGKFLKLFCLRLSTDPEVSMFFNKAKSFFYNNKHEWCCLYVLCYLWALWGELITELSVIQIQQELCCRISLGVDLLNKKLITLTVISQNIRLMHCTILKLLRAGKQRFGAHCFAKQ